MTDQWRENMNKLRAMREEAEMLAARVDRLLSMCDTYPTLNEATRPEARQCGK